MIVDVADQLVDTRLVEAHDNLAEAAGCEPIDSVDQSTVLLIVDGSSADPHAARPNVARPNEANAANRTTGTRRGLVANSARRRMKMAVDPIGVNLKFVSTFNNCRWSLLRILHRSVSGAQC